MEVIKLFKIGDTVRFRERLGKIEDIREVELKKYTGMNNYNLYKVKFEFDSFEWINEMYLTKVI